MTLSRPKNRTFTTFRCVRFSHEVFLMNALDGVSTLEDFDILPLNVDDLLYVGVRPSRAVRLTFLAQMLGGRVIENSNTAAIYFPVRKLERLFWMVHHEIPLASLPPDIDREAFLTVRKTLNGLRRPATETEIVMFRLLVS